MVRFEVVIERILRVLVMAARFSNGPDRVDPDPDPFLKDYPDPVSDPRVSKKRTHI